MGKIENGAFVSSGLMVLTRRCNKYTYSCPQGNLHLSIQMVSYCSHPPHRNCQTVLNQVLLETLQDRQLKEHRRLCLIPYVSTPSVYMTASESIRIFTKHY